jgi:hypothetical protein
MATLMTLMVKLGLDSKGVDEGLDKVGKKTKSTGSAFSKLSGIVGKVAPWATLGSAVLAVGSYLGQASKAAAMNAEVMAKQEAIIKATGGAAGLTSRQLVEMADEMERLTEIDGDLISQSQSLLLTFRNIGGETFPRAMQAAVDLQTTFGSLEASTMQLGKALNDPVAGINALARSGVTFSEAQKDQIKQFVAVNDLASAQAIILAEIEAQVGGTARAISEAGDGAQNLTNATGALSEAVGRGLLPVVQKTNKALADMAWGLAEVIGQQVQASDSLDDYAKMLGISKQHAVVLLQRSQEFREEFERYTRQLEKGALMTEFYNKHLGKTPEIIEQTVEQLEELSKANQDFLKLTGDMMNVEERREKELADFAQKRIDIQAEMQRLATEGHRLGSEEMSAQMQQLQALVIEEQKAAKEFERAGRQRILSMLEQRLAMDGLSTEEMNYLLELGLSWGVYSQAAVNETQRILQEVDKLEQGYKDIKTSIDAIPPTKVVRIHTDMTYTQRILSQGYDMQRLAAGPGFASGTGGKWMTVPQGYPNDTYPIRLQSGEEFSVRSRSDAGKPGADGMTVNLYLDGKLSDTERRNLMTASKDEVMRELSLVLGSV